MLCFEEYLALARAQGIKKMKKQIAWANTRFDRDIEKALEAWDEENEQPRLAHGKVIRELDGETEIVQKEEEMSDGDKVEETVQPKGKRKKRNRKQRADKRAETLEKQVGLHELEYKQELLEMKAITDTNEPKLESEQTEFKAELEEVNIGNLWNEEQSNIVQEELKPKDKTEVELNNDLKVTDTLVCLKIDSFLNDTQVHENIIESCIVSPSENGSQQETSPSENGSQQETSSSENGSQNDLISPSVNGSDDLISPSENGRNHDKLMMINESVNLISHNKENVPIEELLRNLESNFKEDILELKNKFNKEMEKLTQKFMCELESIKKHKEVKKDETVTRNYNVINAQNESKRNLANYEYSQHVNKNVINVINAQNERKRNLANYEYSHHVYKKPKSRCFYCGKTGHYQNQCWHRLANQRRNNYVHRKSCEKYSNLRNVSTSNQNNKSVNRYTNGSYRRNTYYERPKQCHNIYIELVDEPNQHTQSKITTDVVQKPEENIKTNEVTQVTRNLGNDYGSTAKSYNLRERWHTGHRQLHENDYSCYRGC
ncbi:uncharacterized protein LOC131941078 [Physella acuta]|uniref:uncharacterized protein LOC131941078 n=1 Tax=Physella acuta TaxID=109671 RepID=UPI0027DBC896|nr:uncharacterized protein LOC131941078 [Physella acuta]